MAITMESSNFNNCLILGLKSALLEANSEIHLLKSGILRFFTKFTNEQVAHLELERKFADAEITWNKKNSELQAVIDLLKKKLVEKENENINLNFKSEQLRSLIEEKVREMDILKAKSLKLNQPRKDEYQFKYRELKRKVKLALNISNKSDSDFDKYLCDMMMVRENTQSVMNYICTPELDSPFKSRRSASSPSPALSISFPDFSSQSNSSKEPSEDFSLAARDFEKSDPDQLPDLTSLNDSKNVNDETMLRHSSNLSVQIDFPDLLKNNEKCAKEPILDDCMKSDVIILKPSPNEPKVFSSIFDPLFDNKIEKTEKIFVYSDERNICRTTVDRCIQTESAVECEKSIQTENLVQSEKGVQTENLEDYDKGVQTDSQEKIVTATKYTQIDLLNDCLEGNVCSSDGNSTKEEVFQDHIFQDGLVLEILNEMCNSRLSISQDLTQFYEEKVDPYSITISNDLHKSDEKMVFEHRKNISKSKKNKLIGAVLESEVFEKNLTVEQEKLKIVKLVNQLVTNFNALAPETEDLARFAKKLENENGEEHEKHVESGIVEIPEFSTSREEMTRKSTESEEKRLVDRNDSCVEFVTETKQISASVKNSDDKMQLGNETSRVNLLVEQNMPREPVPSGYTGCVVTRDTRNEKSHPAENTTDICEDILCDWLTAGDSKRKSSKEVQNEKFVEVEEFYSAAEESERKSSKEVQNEKSVKAEKSCPEDETNSQHLVEYSLENDCDDSVSEYEENNLVIDEKNSEDESHSEFTEGEIEFSLTYCNATLSVKEQSEGDGLISNSLYPRYNLRNRLIPDHIAASQSVRNKRKIAQPVDDDDNGHSKTKITPSPFQSPFSNLDSYSSQPQTLQLLDINVPSNNLLVKNDTENIISDVIESSEAKKRKLGTPKFYLENTSQPETVTFRKWLTPFEEVWQNMKRIEISNSSENEVVLQPVQDSVLKDAFRRRVYHRRNKPEKLQNLKKIEKAVDEFRKMRRKGLKVGSDKVLKEAACLNQTTVCRMLENLLTKQGGNATARNFNMIDDFMTLTVEIEQKQFTGFVDFVKGALKLKIFMKISENNENLKGQNIMNNVILFSRCYARINLWKCDVNDTLDMLYESLMSQKNRAHPIAFGILSEWPHIFNMNMTKSPLYIEIMMFCLVHHKMKYNVELFKVHEVQQLMKFRYGMKLGEKTAEEYARDAMIRIGEIHWVEAMVLLCKRQMFMWTYTNVIMKYFVPLLHAWFKENVCDIILVKVLEALDIIMMSCPVSMLQSNVFNFKAIIEALENVLNGEKGSRRAKETACITVCRLATWEFSLCSKILSSWQPPEQVINIEVLDKMSVVMKRKMNSDWLAFLQPKRYQMLVSSKQLNSLSRLNQQKKSPAKPSIPKKNVKKSKKWKGKGKAATRVT